MDLSRNAIMIKTITVIMIITIVSMIMMISIVIIIMTARPACWWQGVGRENDEDY